MRRGFATIDLWDGFEKESWEIENLKEESIMDLIYVG